MRMLFAPGYSINDGSHAQVEPIEGEDERAAHESADHCGKQDEEEGETEPFDRFVSSSKNGPHHF